MNIETTTPKNTLTVKAEVPYISYVLQHLSDRFGSGVIDLLLGANRFSGPYLRWEAVRKLRCPGSGGFGGYFVGLAGPGQDQIAVAQEQSLIHTKVLLDQMTIENPFDQGRKNALNKLLEYLSKEPINSLQHLPSWFGLFHRLRATMRQIPLSKHAQEVNAQFRLTTSQMVNFLPPVDATYEKGSYTQVYELPGISIPCIAINPAPGEAGIIVNGIGILGTPVMVAVEKLPETLLEKYIPYGPPKGTEARELLDIFAHRIIAQTVYPELKPQQQ